MSENRKGKERKGEKGGNEGFECGVCLELMSWEKEARMLPSCGHSFCFSCLNKLFQHSSSSPSSSSPSSPSSSSSSSSPSSSPAPSPFPSSSSPSSSSPSSSSSLFLFKGGSGGASSFNSGGGQTGGSSSPSSLFDSTGSPPTPTPPAFVAKSTLSPSLPPSGLISFGKSNTPTTTTTFGASGGGGQLSTTSSPFGCTSLSLFSSSSPSPSPSPFPSSSSPSSSSSSSSFSSTSSSCCFGSVKCPICREVSQCESVESLEVNFLIPEMISVLLSSNILSSSSEQSECANFEVCGNQTQMFCLMCDMFICDLCDSSHTSTTFTRNHKRKQRNNINSLNERGLEELRKRECPKHPSELICGYCLECCVFVCFRCVLDPHVHHKEKVKNLEESALKKRDEVVEIGVERLEKTLEVIEGRRKKVEEEMKELEEKLEKKRVEMKEIELEKEDLRIRKDSIVRLSNTPSDVSLFDDQLFATLLQTAIEIASEVGISTEDHLNESRSAVVGRAEIQEEKRGREESHETEDEILSKKRAICCDHRLRFLSLFRLRRGPVRGVSVNSDGTIFVCGNGDCGMGVRDKEGNMIYSIQKTIGSLNLNPVDVSIGLNDEIVVLDWYQGRYDCEVHYRVVLLTKEGEWMQSFGSNGIRYGQFHEPSGVAVDQEGRIIVSDTGNNRIQVFRQGGAFIRSFNGSSEGQLSDPEGVAVDGDGNVVFCDWGNNRIEVMDIEGNFIRRFGTSGSGDSQLDGPRSVAVDGEGRIFVTEEGNGRVSVFKKDGTFLFSFGQGHMKKPWGVVVDSFGSIIVSDTEKESVEFWKEF